MGISKVGALLLGHGTTSSDGREEFLCLFDNLCSMNPNLPLSYAFLEYAYPDAEVAIQGLIQRKITSIFLLPLFLFQGVHLKYDIPKLIKKMESKYKVNIQLLDYFGVCNELIDLSANIIEETRAKQPDSTKEKTILILAGVGSSVQKGNEEFRAMAQKIIIKTGSKNSHIGFLSKLASPKVETILEAIQFEKGHTIILHPLLFFQGMYTKHLQKMPAIQSLRQKSNIKITTTYGTRPELVKQVQGKLNAVLKQPHETNLHGKQ